jgi:hypothetical protein
MKLNLKHSVGKLEQFNVRIPAALKQRLDATRKRVEARGIDFVGTLTATLDDFDVSLNAQLKDQPQSGSEIATDSVAPTLHENGSANGFDATKKSFLQGASISRKQTDLD